MDHMHGHTCHQKYLAAGLALWNGTQGTSGATCSRAIQAAVLLKQGTKCALCPGLCALLQMHCWLDGLRARHDRRPLYMECAALHEGLLIARAQRAACNTMPDAFSTCLLLCTLLVQPWNPWNTAADECAPTHGLQGLALLRFERSGVVVVTLPRLSLSQTHTHSWRAGGRSAALMPAAGCSVQPARCAGGSVRSPTGCRELLRLATAAMHARG